MAKPFELKSFCWMPKRSEAPEEIRDCYLDEEVVGPNVYWSETETESYDGRLGLPYCDDDETEEEEEEAVTDHVEERTMSDGQV